MIRAPRRPVTGMTPLGCYFGGGRKPHLFSGIRPKAATSQKEDDLSMNIVRKSTEVALRFGPTAVAMLIVTAVAHAGMITLNFDATPLGPGVGMDASAYLASFGITLSGVTPGASVLIIGQGFPGLSITTSPPNYFNEFNGNNPETMTLNFSNPLSSIRFFRTGMTFDSKPEWSAQALNAQGGVVSMVREPLTATGTVISAQQFTLGD